MSRAQAICPTPLALHLGTWWGHGWRSRQDTRGASCVGSDGTSWHGQLVEVEAIPGPVTSDARETKRVVPLANCWAEVHAAASAGTHTLLRAPWNKARGCAVYTVYGTVWVLDQ